MKKTLLATVLSLLAAASASAGQKGNDFVTIMTQFSVATGAMGSARNSTDVMQLIGCGLVANAGSTTYVSCSAMDAKGNRAWCVSTNAEFVRAAQGIGTDSDLVFGWDASGNCTQLNVYNGSNNPPKAP
jgi:hypothetical protein